MLSILKISWRSIWRSRRRTLISTSAVAFGLALLLFAFGMITGMIEDAADDLGSTGMGHIQIYPRDYRIKKDARHLLTDPEAIAARVVAATPEGSAVGWRVVVRGLATSAWGSRGVRIYGIDPVQEARLSAFFTTMRAGEPLRPGDDKGIVVGAGIARRLKLKVKSKLRVMAQRTDGEMSAELFRVRGIFNAASPAVSDTQAFVSTAASHRLLGIAAGGHEVVAQLPRANLAGPIVAQLRPALGETVEVLSFADLFPVLEQFQAIIDRVMLIMILGIYSLVGLGILNTLLMSVMERTREFGVMMAVGTRRWRLVAQVVGEAFWIATIGVALGVLAGAALTWAVAEFELLDWSEAMGEGMDFAGSTISTVMNPRLQAADAIRAAAVVWVLTLAIGFYPAWRVSKFFPADALRSN